MSTFISSQKKKTGVKKILMENNLTSNQVLEDAENQIREACEVLQREATRLRQQKAIPSRRHVGKNRALSSLVDCKPPCWRPPFYDKSSNADKRSMFSGKLEVTPLEDGAFFIDRDGKHFRFILNYICTGKLTSPKGDKDRRNYGRSFIRSKGF